MELLNFKSAYSLVKTLYDIEVSEDDFEDIGLVAWGLINNKHTRMYKFVGDVVNGELRLPCNADEIESVHIPLHDAQMTSNKTVFNAVETLFIESYIDIWKLNTSPYEQRGLLVKYKEGNNTLYFDRDYKNVIVIYQGIFVDDEDGLPLINEKEQLAIATYVAYVSLMKDAIRRRDSVALQLAGSIKTDWLQKCNAARIPKYLSQNDMNAILDAKARWDRKQYGKSFKPIK